MIVRAPDTPPQDPDVAVRVCEPMCRALAAAYYAPGVDADDLLQAARLGAWEAWRDWRPDGGSSFHGFARLCITRELASAVSAARRRKHQPVSDAVRFETPIADGSQRTIGDTLGGTSDPTLERVAAREELRRALWAVELRLSTLERDVVIGFFAGDESYSEIAERLGAPVKSVDNALQRARRKLERDVDAPGRRRAGVYVARRHTPTGLGCATVEQAIAAARGLLGEDYLDATVVSCIPRAVGPDGCERRDTRGRPRDDGRRPEPVWRVVLEATGLPVRLAA